MKLRGYRLELGEVEAAALAAPGVTLAAAVVCNRGDADAEGTVGADAAGVETEPGAAVHQLVLYVTPADVSVVALRAALRARLPAHAQPNMVMPLPVLPTSAAGKFDRTALSAVAAGAGAAAAAGGTVGPTATQIAALTSQAEEALGIPVGLTRECGTGASGDGGSLLAEVPRSVGMAGGGSSAEGLVEGGEGDPEGQAGDERLAEVWGSVWAARFSTAMPTEVEEFGSTDAVEDGATGRGVTSRGAEWRGVGYLQPAGGPFECSSATLEAWADSAARRIRTLAAGRTRRVLEVGCGTGLLATRLAPWFDYLGTDPAASVVGRLRRELPRASFEVGAAHALRPEQHCRNALVLARSYACDHSRSRGPPACWGSPIGPERRASPRLAAWLPREQQLYGASSGTCSASLASLLWIT